jgi:hypothetical protein
MQICVSYNKVVISRKNINLLDKLTANQLITKSPTLDETGKLIAMSTTHSHLTQPSAHVTEFNLVPFKILILSSTLFHQICRQKLSKLGSYSVLGYCSIEWGFVTEVSYKPVRTIIRAVRIFCLFHTPTHLCMPPRLKFLDLVNIIVFCEKRK